MRIRVRKSVCKNCGAPIMPCASNCRFYGYLHVDSIIPTHECLPSNKPGIEREKTYAEPLAINARIPRNIRTALYIYIFGFIMGALGRSWQMKGKRRA